MKKNVVTIVQFVHFNWVVEGIGKKVKSEDCNLLSQSRAASSAVKKSHW
jgi:hypothetical protein